MQDIYELMHNPVNNVQKKIVDDVKSGARGESFSKEQVASIVIEALISVDHEAREREYMDKCINRCARTYISLSSALGDEVYVSALKNQMSNTNYFKTLDKMTTARGVNVMRLICSRLVRDGIAEMVGTNKIKMNEKAYDFIGDRATDLL